MIKLLNDQIIDQIIEMIKLLNLIGEGLGFLAVHVLL